MSIGEMAGVLGMALAGFFAIMNPIANTPIFVSVTEGDDRATMRAVARRSVVIAFVVVAAVVLTGNALFELFGITMAAFRITGGILVFLIGLQMLHGTGSGAHTPSDADVASSREAELGVAVSPLAIPLLAGPGTIATAVSLAAGNWIHAVITLVAFAIICLITYICFLESNRLAGFLGQNGLNVVTRLMGLVVASLGTGMVLSGLGWHPGG